MVTVTLLAVAAVMVAGGTALAATPTPAKCSPADIRRETTLNAGTFRKGGNAYATFCGTGQAVVRVGPRSYTIQGGHCGSADSLRFLGFGVIANGPLYPGAIGISLVLRPGAQPGRVSVVSSIVQVAGLDVTPTGTAVLSKGLKSGTFGLVTTGSSGQRITGSWTC